MNIEFLNLYYAEQGLKIQNHLVSPGEIFKPTFAILSYIITILKHLNVQYL